MTWDHWAHLIDDYGPVAFLLILLVLLALLLIKLWPIASATVTAVNTVKDLPALLETHRAETSAAVAVVAKAQKKQSKQLAAHLADATTKIALLTTLDDRLDRIESVGAEVKHEVQNNGGSSVKDAVDRSERVLNELRSLLGASTAPVAVHVSTGPVPAP